MSNDVLGSISEAYQRKLETIRGLKSDLEEACTDAGISLRINFVTDTQDSNKSQGVRKYWAKIRRLSKKFNLPVSEAREQFRTGKKVESVVEVAAVVVDPKTRTVSNEVKSDLRKFQKKYWKKVKHYAIQNGCTIKEARERLKRNGVAETVVPSN